MDSLMCVLVDSRYFLKKFKINFFFCSLRLLMMAGSRPTSMVLSVFTLFLLPNESHKVLTFLSLLLGTTNSLPSFIQCLLVLQTARYHFFYVSFVLAMLCLIFRLGLRVEGVNSVMPGSLLCSQGVSYYWQKLKDPGTLMLARIIFVCIRLSRK